MAGSLAETRILGPESVATDDIPDQLPHTSVQRPGKAFGRVCFFFDHKMNVGSPCPVPFVVPPANTVFGVDPIKLGVLCFSTLKSS